MEQEIVTTDSDETPLVYPQAMLFIVLKEDGRLHQAEPEEPLEMFGAPALFSRQDYLPCCPRLSASIGADHQPKLDPTGRADCR